MALKQGLQIKMGQSLTMTPQLQQAIRLLQLSSLDLQQEIQGVLEANPMLEVEEGFDDVTDGADPNSAADNDTGNDPADTTEIDGDLASSTSDTPELGSTETSEQLPDDLPVDTDWDDLYQPAAATSAPSGDGDWDFADVNSAPESLHDSLLWQLNLLNLSDLDRAIGEIIIDAINADGMLSQSIEEITESLLANLSAAERASAAATDPDEPAISEAEVGAVLKMIQQFEPTGIGARDLPECLLLQLATLPEDTPHLCAAQTIVGEHLNLLGARDFTGLKRASKMNEELLAKVIELIQSLNPRPGSALSSEAPEYIVPDVFVRKEKGRWRVELNPDSTPKLRINSGYAGLIKRADNSPDNTFLKDNLQEARWFMKSLQSRHETLLKVATKIVEHQRGFLDYGPEAMKPLVLHDIADAVEMHESTISRVTSRKYMHTPRGIFELKYFFSSHVGTTSGGEVSSTAIRALIKKLTEEEDAKKPLSDSKLAAILKEQNIKVARRTVAKYRESMNIPPSNERKQLV
ncbi:MAG: RNA polymerase factor sigma-54 [Pseudomonadales bacterium]